MIQIKKALKILEDAISDVGLWTWWESESLNYIQIEFDGTQLWSPPLSEGKPPCGQIATRFDDLISGNFLTFDTNKVAVNWPELLSQDKIAPFNLDSEAFTFSDPKIIRKLIAQSAEVYTFHGTPPQEVDWTAAPIKLGFRSGDVGFVVAAREIELLDFRGEISFDEIEERSRKWWTYWEEYWRLIDTESPLPEDYACEVTIPENKFIESVEKGLLHFPKDSGE